MKYGSTEVKACTLIASQFKGHRVLPPEANANATINYEMCVLW